MIIQELLGLLEAKGTDLKGMKAVATIESLEDSQTLEITGDIIMHVYYADYPSLEDDEERFTFKSLKTAATVFNGKVKRREFADYEVKGTIAKVQDLRDFFEEYDDEVNDEDFGGDSSDGFAWSFDIYQVEAKK